MEYQKIFNTKGSSEQEQKVKGIQITNSEMTDVNPILAITLSVNKHCSQKIEIWQIFKILI